MGSVLAECPTMYHGVACQEMYSCGMSSASIFFMKVPTHDWFMATFFTVMLTRISKKIVVMFVANISLMNIVHILSLSAVPVVIASVTL